MTSHVFDNNCKKQWIVLWRKTEYDLHCDEGTTISDFKRQLELLTGVKKSNIKFAGLKVIKQYRKIFKKIKDDTLISQLECTVKKGNCFKMIGTPTAQIFTGQNLKFENKMRLVLKAMLSKYNNLIIPASIRSLIVHYIIDTPFVFNSNNNYFQRYKNQFTVSNNGLCLRFHPISWTNRDCILPGPIFSNFQNISFYECRIKILELKIGSEIKFVGYRNENQYKDWEINHKICEIYQDTNKSSDNTYNAHANDYVLEPWVTSENAPEMAHYITDHWSKWKIKTNKRYWFKHDHIINIHVNYSQNEIVFCNEITEETFTKKIVNQKYPFYIVFKGSQSKILILEQYSLLK